MLMLRLIHIKLIYQVFPLISIPNVGMLGWNILLSIVEVTLIKLVTKGES